MTVCGRYVLATSITGLAEAFGARCPPDVAAQYQPSWNVPPTRTVLGVLVDGGERVLQRFRWGLVPAWAKDPAIGNRTFNARAETVATKPSFRAAFKSRRLIVPADGFYEWSKAAGDARQPYLFERADGQPLAFAGLWERWRPDVPVDVPGAEMRTCAIVTTDAGADVVELHERQPVVLERRSWDVWLDPDVHDRDELEGLLHASPAGTLVRHRVGRAVGRAGLDGPELAESLDEA